MSELLYKISKPRTDWKFEPSRFWRTEDWSSSTTNSREGYIEDWVLYAAGFDEVNIHLLPNVWRLRVWLDNEKRSDRLSKLGYSWAPASRAVIFAQKSDRDRIEAFTPTIYTFEKAGFEQTPSNEFVARDPQSAVSAEIIPFEEAIQRWQFELIYIEDAEGLVQSLRSNGIDHQIQT